MTLWLLVHGYNVWDGGRGTIGKLRPFITGPYIMINYGYFGLLDVRFKNRRIARLLADACHNAKKAGYTVHVAAHSNGCAITHLAGHAFDAPIDKAVYIAPALDKDARRAPSVKNIDVWHSPDDKPVRWSKYLPFHPWGEMGARGYRGVEDQNIRNFNKQYGYSLRSDGHSDCFRTDLLPLFGKIIIETGEMV